ncbi:MAG TPA: hypothetical protein VJN44_21795, partial [Roseateles sp.]|nr:hypothetical protein [Roseateles sp.]
ILAETILELERLGAQAQVTLADEIFGRQPTLLGAVLVLKGFGASNAQIGIALHVLFVSWVSMKRCATKSKVKWPKITEDDHDLCMQRLTARINFIEDIPADLRDEAFRQQVADYPEPYLLAYAFGYLREQGVSAVASDLDKQVWLSSLGVVECVAYAGSRIKR